MTQAEERPNLDAVLFIRRLADWNTRAVLNEHQFNPDHIIAHDPLALDTSIPEDDQDWADVRWTDYVAQFLNRSRPKRMVCSFISFLDNSTE